MGRSVPLRQRRVRLVVAIAAAFAGGGGPAAAADHVWLAGSFAAGVTAPNPLPALDTLFAQGAADKNFVGVAFTSLGTVAWQTDSRIGFIGSSIANEGLWDLQADANLTYAGGSASTFANSGIFRKSAGGGSSVIGGNVVFSNSGVIDAQSGTIDFAGGNATFNAGTQFTGAGTARISNNASFVGTFTSASLLLAGGTFTGNAGTPAVLQGSVRWTGGAIAGTWQVETGQTLVAQAGIDKNFSGTNFTNAGTVSWQTNERAGFASSSITNTGLWDLQADANLTYAGGSASSFTNSGTFRKSAGGGSSVIGGNVVFSNSGVIDAQSGTIDFAGGNATFNAGTQFAGAGTVRIGNNTSFVGAFTSANLVLADGTFTGNNLTPAVLNGNVRWTGGSLAGTWQIASGQTLVVQGGLDKNFNGASFTNAGTVSWQTTDRAGFASSSIANESLWDLQADANLTYIGASASTFTNSGTFRKSAGIGSAVIGSNVVFGNSGIIDAQSGTIDFSGGNATFNAGTQFTGAGTVRIGNNASFAGAFTSANLVLADGTFTGNAGTPAVLQGSVRWTGGSLAGTWQIASGQTLVAQAGADKNFSGTSFTNAGTVSWQTTDRAGFASSSITNTGLWDLQADANLTYIGASASSFTNSGTFRKSAGMGSAVIGSNVVFGNSGIIDAQSGTIDFAGGNATFNAGTQFTGAGTVRIGNNASFAGAFTSANLVLADGTFTGNAGTPAVLQGSVHWTGGRFAGTWHVGSGQTLVAQSLADKDFSGTSFTNAGTVSWQTTDRAGFASSSITNSGLWDLQADANLTYIGASASSFANSGTFRKSAGAGTATIGNNVVFGNAGTVEVLSGTLAFTNAFTSTGTVRGTGTLQAPTFTNNGRVEPGAAAGAPPATLAIAGSFAQSALGVLEIDLQSTSQHDLLLVSGSASLGGTLEVSCFASCVLAEGDQVTVLDYTGSRGGSQFSGLALSGFAAGDFDLVYDDVQTRVLLRVTEATVPAIPEPASWWLMVGGLAAVATRRRQRRP